VHLDGFLLYPARCEAMSDASHVGVLIEEGDKDPSEDGRLFAGQYLINLPDFDVVFEVDVEMLEPLIKLI
jgi:hypothetical protein